jgi:pilus assembly protein CpaB
MSRRNIVIVLVVILALGAGLLAYGILTAPKKTTETRPVVTALAAIPAKAVITPAMIAIEQRDVTTVPVDAAAGAGDVVGYTATSEIAAGDVIESTKLQKVAPGPPVTVKLDPGMRAVTIPVDLVKSVAGLAVPGDHVESCSCNYLKAPRQFQFIYTRLLSKIPNYNNFILNKNETPSY